jgi:DNA-binding MarR family transcriptional regulator
MDRLSEDDMTLWQAWKLATETVRTSVAADIAASTGLSDPDFGVLTRVTEIGGGRMRQNRLAELMGYHRSRLSHHLTRMEERGLIAREPAAGGVEVVVTAAGRAAVGRARPVHAEAVRRYLIQPLSSAQQAQLLRVLRALAPAG